MLAGALVITFGVASTLQGWATARSSAVDYSASATDVAPAPTAGSPGLAGARRARLHAMSPSPAPTPGLIADTKF